ncbi:MAG: AraC family transcriptional regulator [Alphaproteobacteria bacterium]|nr:AraC family transcriptional regulator [Alphaproteobacteria bacterium]
MSARYWRLDGFEGVDLLRSDASTHRYARHSHEGYAVGVVEAGAHAFAARGRVWTAIPGSVIIVNPDDAHDGGPAASDDRYTYRMLYVDGAVVAAALEEAVGRRAATSFFPDSVVGDATLAERLSRLHRAFERPEARLQRETLLVTALVQLARRHGRAPPHVGRGPSGSRAVALALDYLAANFAEDCSLAELAALAGVDRFHLLRAFRRRVGLPPHLYQTQLRLRHAKRLMLAGESPAMAAVAAGFADQSHLIRKFKAAYGVTPGDYLGRCGKSRALQ